MRNMGESMLSASDVALLTNRNGNNGDGVFGDNGAWWIIIFLIFAFGGWGNNGFGGNRSGGTSGGVMDAYVLNSDFATLSRQVDNGFDRIGNRIENVNNGLCDGFYAINTAFGNLNTTLCQEFGNTNNLITQNGYESRLATQSLASQLADCCCTLRQQISDSSCTTNRNIDQVRFDMAMNTNTLQNSMCNNTRDIIQSQECGTRAILDAITQNKIENKNAQITAQQNEINALRLSASQERQNNYLINQLKPCPSPSYLVPNPNCCYGNYGFNGYGFNGGCGCNNI